MATKIGINGFNRIGRLVFRLLIQQADRFEIVGVNDLANTRTLASLLKYDSIYGRFSGSVEYDQQHLIVDGRPILVTFSRDPAELPWGELDVDIAIENNLYLRNRQTNGRPGYDGHLAAGARRVVLTFSALQPDRMVVAGLNDDQLSPDDRCVSCGSIATGAIAPITKVISDRFGIRCGHVTMVDSYTGDQQILDFPHPDPYRARAAAINIIPTLAGSAEGVGLIVPELRGKLMGHSIRVPTPAGRCLDMVVNTERPVTVNEINATLREASEGEMKGILGYSEDPIVLTDILGDPHAATIAADWTSVVDDHMLKIIAWYDNEWSYACRVVTLIDKIGEM